MFSLSFLRLVYHTNLCLLFCNAKGRLSKKARTDASAEDVEPEKIPEGADGDADIAVDDFVEGVLD